MDRVTALLIKDSSGVERLVVLRGEPLVLGREVGCEIRLESSYVSRKHARIEQQTAGAVLVDLDSENGCFVNDRRVRTAVPLSAGDVIGIADVSIRCLARLTPAPATQRYERALVRPLRLVDVDGPTAAASQPSPASSAAPSPVQPGRRSGGTSGKRATDVLHVQARTHEVWLGQAVPRRRPSAQEFKLLAYLYEHQDRVCTRQELGDAIWPPDGWDVNMLYRLVHRLKDKIEPDGAGAEQPRYVQTIPQVGYRLTA